VNVLLRPIYEKGHFHELPNSEKLEWCLESMASKQKILAIIANYRIKKKTRLLALETKL
jgi:hypothetical protein